MRGFARAPGRRLANPLGAMNASLRSGLVCFILLLVATWLVPLGGLTWAAWFLNDHIYSAPFGWVSWPALVSWSYYAIVFLALGAALQLIGPSPRSKLMALVLGSIYSVLWFVRSSYHFSDAATIFDYFWVSGDLLVPPLASYGGVVLVSRLIPYKAVPSIHGA
jgi:hypothetical protein